jgi:hypothetical protein
MSTLLTPKDAARLLKLSTRTLERFRVSGDGPAFSKLGGRVRYEQARVLEWVKARSRSSTSAHLSNGVSDAQS